MSAEPHGHVASVDQGMSQIFSIGGIFDWPCRGRSLQGPNLFNPKLIRLTHLLSFASLLVLVTARVADMLSSYPTRNYLCQKELKQNNTFLGFRTCCMEILKTRDICMQVLSGCPDLEQATKLKNTPFISTPFSDNGPNVGPKVTTFPSKVTIHPVLHPSEMPFFVPFPYLIPRKQAPMSHVDTFLSLITWI